MRPARLLRNIIAKVFPITNPDLSLMRLAGRRLFQDLPLILFVALIGLIMAGIVLFVDAQGMKGLSIETLMRDPLQTANLPFHTGLVSNLGIAMWITAASITLFSYGLVRRIEPRNHELRRFLFWGGTLTAILGLDDFFLLHEEGIPKALFPKGGWLHISEIGVFAIYALWAIAFVWFSRVAIINRSRFVLLLFALVCLAISMAIDAMGMSSMLYQRGHRLLFEDGFKFAGIIAWTIYFVDVSGRSLLEAFAVSRASGCPAPK